MAPPPLPFSYPMLPDIGELRPTPPIVHPDVEYTDEELQGFRQRLSQLTTVPNIVNLDWVSIMLFICGYPRFLNNQTYDENLRFFRLERRILVDPSRQWNLDEIYEAGRAPANYSLIQRTSDL
jgi:hypothetical protein